MRLDGSGAGLIDRSRALLDDLAPVISQAGPESIIRLGAVVPGRDSLPKAKQLDVDGHAIAHSHVEFVGALGASANAHELEEPDQVNSQP